MTDPICRFKICSLFLTLLPTIGLFLPNYVVAQETKYERVEQHMGCDFWISIYCDCPEKAERVLDSAFVRIRELDGSLSNYKSDSELNRLCRSAPHETPVQVGRDLFVSLEMSHQIYRLSDGAFDPTVGPVTKLWRRARRNQKFPGDERIARTMTAVGFDHVQLFATSRSVALRKPNMQLDLGGIAKGFAVDEALKVTKSEGVTRACVNGGGDVAVSDSPPGQDGWKIGIAAANEKLSDQTLVLTNMAVATSGDLFQSVEFHGVRYSHIIDPRTGYGLTNSAAVTVIAPTCAVADGMASAISVLGIAKGLKLAASRPGIEAMCSELKKPGGDQLRTESTMGFSRFVSNAAAK